MRLRPYPPAHASRACPTCALTDAKPGQARVSWRGGSSAVAPATADGVGGLRSLRIGDLKTHACSVLAASPHPRPLPATRFARGGRGEEGAPHDDLVRRTLVRSRRDRVPGRARRPRGPGPGAQPAGATVVAAPSPGLSGVA